MKRIILFGAVGLFCYGIQLGLIMLAEALLHMHLFWVGVVAFIVSAQCNFFLSRWLTWRDRRHERSAQRHWIAFNAVVLAGSLVNGAVLVMVTSLLPLPQWLLVFVANAVSSTFTFLCNHFVVFRKEKK